MPVARTLSFMLASALALAGCYEAPDDGSEDSPALRALPPPNEPSVFAYPEGPYGVAEGATIANYRFQGFPDPKASRGELRPIELADFFNPTGDGVHDEDSGLDGPKPKVLMVTVSALWCAPCKEEAEKVLPGKYAELAPRGVEFLLNLADGPAPGVPAEPKHLVKWTESFDVAYPSSIDPTYQLGAIVQSDAYPLNFIVETRAMTITYVVAGSPRDDFWQAVEAALARAGG